MKMTNSDSSIILAPEAKAGSSEASLLDEFYDEVTEKISKFRNRSLILNFSGIKDVDLNKILLFSQVSAKHKKQGNSFVMVCQDIEFDLIPGELIVVPTLKEAQDIIEMEDIERDLGI